MGANRIGTELTVRQARDIKQRCVATKVKTLVLPTGEELTYWRSANGTCTIDVKFERAGPIVVSSTADTFEDALLTLAARFKTLGIELENLANNAP